MAQLNNLAPAVRLVRSARCRFIQQQLTSQQAAISTRGKVLREWFYVPLGITVTLAACFGVDSIFQKLHVSFPASVACLVLLFLALIASESTLGTHKTRRLIALIDVSVS